MSSNRDLVVRCPFDDSIYGTCTSTTAEQVPASIARARRAQATWAAAPVTDRARVFRRLAALILDNRDKILDTIQAETGKARLSAFEEVMDASRAVRVFAGSAPGLLRPRRRAGAIPVLTRTVEHHRPVGVVGIINPWNYPFNLPASDGAQALLAGNAVVLKPDSQTPFTALLLAELLTGAGLPDGLFQVLPGSGAELGPALVAGVDYLMFTGSTATGRQLATACAERLIGFSGELGGKNPLLVLDDADLATAAAGTVHGAFANTGQVCVGIERAYIHQSVHDEFVDRLVALVRGLRLGVGYDWNLAVGSLSSAKQLATVSAHGRPCQRQPVRAERQCVVRAPRARGRRPAAHWNSERQRGLCRGLGVARRSDGWHGRVGRRTAPRRPRPAAVHRAADGQRPAAAPDPRRRSWATRATRQ